ALLAELEEDLAQRLIVVGAGGQVALGTTNGEGRRLRAAPLRQAPAERTVLDDLLDLDLGDTLAGSLGFLGGRSAIRERLPDLAVVAVDGQGLETELPALQVDVLDLL